MLTYDWIFGDGDTAIGETISHTYRQPGVYTAQLAVTDDDGSMDSTSCEITVTAAVGTPPSAGFTATPSSGEVPLAVNFNASASFDPDGSIASYAWSFDDGGSGSGAIVTHTYTSADTYYPLLCVTDDDGNQDYAAQTVRVLSSPGGNNPPTANFTASPTSGEAPLAVSFNASGSSDSDGSITSYAWSFGDGGSSSGVTAAHTYNSVGTYTARLTITDDDGATDTTTTQIEVSASSVPEDLYVDANSGSDTAGDGTQTNPYKTITKAVGVANVEGIASCTIHVAAGIYNAVLGEESPITLGHGISLMGEGSAREDVKILVQVYCRADSSLQNVEAFRGVILSDRLSGTALLNIHIDGPANATGIYIDHATEHIRIANCLIENCEFGVKVGTEDTLPSIQDCVIDSCYSGILCWSPAVIEGCTILNCSNGIDIHHMDQYPGVNTVKSTEISDCSTGISVMYGPSNLLIEDTLIIDNDTGIYIPSDVIEMQLDLGGGNFDGIGGNTITGSSGYNIKDKRPSFCGPIYAKNNTWDDPQPSGMVNGPIDNPPNYKITNEGNSIIFSN